MRASHLVVSALAAAALSVACQHKTEVPALSGPSSLSTTLNVTATPDSISQDGAAQSSVQVQAIGPDGRPMSGVAIRLDMSVNGVLFDYGTLSSKSIVTGSDGVARAVYTAPPPPPASSGGTPTRVVVSAYPLGTDAQTTHVFETQIRLMPIGVILPPAESPVPVFTISPQPVALNVPTTFDASASLPGNGSVAITSYQWNFGDGGTASGGVVIHTYSTTGAFTGSLTVTNDRGVSKSAPILVTLAGNPSDVFTGDWFISPVTPAVNSPVIFNADPVQTSPGHQITTYNWTFGDGTSGTGFMTTHTFTVAGTYNVVLSVTDDLGRKKVFNPKPISIGTGNPVPTITTSPSSPTAGNAVLFDASATATSNGASIVAYSWNFGDGFSSTVGPNVSHIFTTAGTYTVRLTVTDDQGRTGTVTITVTIG